MKLAVFSAVVATPAVAQSSAISKVVDLFQNMVNTLAEEAVVDEKVQQENKVACASNSGRLESEIDNSGKRITKFDGEVIGHQNTISAGQGRLPKFSSEIAAAQKMSKEATEVRETEKADFQAAQTELEETIEMLTKAGKILKGETDRVGGDEAAGLLQKDVKKVEETLALVLSSARISTQKKDTLAAMIQTSKASAEDDDDDDIQEIAAPAQAIAVAYESKSGQIVATLQEMKGEAEQTLSDSRKAETDAQHAYELLVQDASHQVKNLEEEISQTKAEVSAAQQELGGAQKDLSTETASNGEFKEHLSALNHQCTKSEQNYVVRSQNRGKQKTGLEQAISILSGTGSSAAESFLQTGTRTAEADVRQRVATMLQKSSDEFKDLTLAEVAQRVKEGTGGFEKVTKLIEGLVDKLVKQQQEEADMHAFCTKETETSEAKLAEHTRTTDKLTARKDKTAASLVDSEQEKIDNTQALQELQEDVGESTNLRNEKKANFDAASEQLSSDIDALGQAYDVLSETFGDAAAFIQMSTQKQSPDFGVTHFQGSDMTTAAEGPTEIIMVEKQTAETTLAELKRTENSEVEGYKTFKQESEVETAQRTATDASLNQRIESLKRRVEESNTDLAQELEELNAVKTYYAKVQKQCARKAPTFEERAAKREQELQGLRNALTVLEGRSFLQKVQRHQ